MNILIVKTSALGDILQCFAVLGYLRRFFPEAAIDWVAEAEYADLLRSHPAIRRFIPIATRRWRRRPFLRRTVAECRQAIGQLRQENYDHIFDLQGNIKSGLIVLFAKGKTKVGFSFSNASEWPSALAYSHRYQPLREGSRACHYLSIAEQHMKREAGAIEQEAKLIIGRQEVNWIDTVAASSSRSIRLMICMGSRWENKKLSLATWKLFLLMLKRQLTPFFFFSWGTQEEKKEAERLQAQFKDDAIVLPRLQLPVWQRLMAKMDAVIAVDSGALHLAATTPTPSFGIFGPSLASYYQPDGDNRGYFQGHCPYGEQFSLRCPKLRRCPTGACLKEAEAAALARAFFTWWHDGLQGE